MLYMVLYFRVASSGSFYLQKVVENSLNKSQKITKNMFKNIDAIYMVLHFRVASSGSFYLQKVIENSLKKSQKITKNMFKNIDAIYGIALQGSQCRVLLFIETY